MVPTAAMFQGGLQPQRTHGGCLKAFEIRNGPLVRSSLMLNPVACKLLSIHSVRTQKLQVRDDVVNIVVCQHDEPA
jgi:hypothetical protein